MGDPVAVGEGGDDHAAASEVSIFHGRRVVRHGRGPVGPVHPAARRLLTRRRGDGRSTTGPAPHRTASAGRCCGSAAVSIPLATRSPGGRPRRADPVASTPTGSSSRVEVRFDVGTPRWLGPRQRAGPARPAGPGGAGRGRGDRSQARNRELALERLARRIDGALRGRRVPRPRPTTRRRRSAGSGRSERSERSGAGGRRRRTDRSESRTAVERGVVERPLETGELRAEGA